MLWPAVARCLLDRFQEMHEAPAVCGAQAGKDAILHHHPDSATAPERPLTRRGQAGQQDAPVSRVLTPAQQPTGLEAFDQDVHGLRGHPEFARQV